MKKPYVLLIPCLLFTGCATNDHLTLKENERTFEYGEAVSADPADYLKETDKAILDAVEVSVEQEGTLIEEQELRSTDEKGNPLDMLNVGEYDLHLRYEEEEETVHLVVTDTTAPEWVDFPKTLRLEKGSEKEALREHFQCKDLSKCSISIEGDYDLSKAGNYTITVIAKDASDNQISKECKLTVYEPKKTSSGGSAQSGNSGSSNTANQTPSTGNSSGDRLRLKNRKHLRHPTIPLMPDRSLISSTHSGHLPVWSRSPGILPWPAPQTSAQRN